MTTKPEQELSLLPGEYYHPEAKYEEDYHDSAKTHLERRGHWLHRKPHGIWEWYHPNGTLSCRTHNLHGKLHGLWEDYREDGTLQWLRFWYEDNKTHVFHTLFKAATGSPLPLIPGAQITLK